jgi:hypothetical protein
VTVSGGWLPCTTFCGGCGGKYITGDTGHRFTGETACVVGEKLMDPAKVERTLLAHLKYGIKWLRLCCGP